MKEVRVLEIKESVFADNDRQADNLRRELKEQGVFLMNLMSSPGSGKTTTLTRTIEQLKNELKIGVMEADIDSDVDFDSYNTDGFYDIIQRPDNTFEENYQKLTDSEKQEIQNLNWNYKDGLLYATNENHKRCINGTSQYYMKNSKLINTMENSGYKGIKKWMEQCEKDTAGIKVKVGDKTYLFHNTDKWHTFKKNGLTCLYNYKRFIIRFDFNKVIGFRSNLSDLPQSGREMWTAISDHSGSAANEVILRSYNDEELYARKNVQIFLQDHKIKQMLIYWDETEAFKGFTKEEKIFLKGCFEKMGISSKDAQEWLNTFMIKKTPQSGKLGSWTYSKGNSKNQVISLINNNENEITKELSVWELGIPRDCTLQRLILTGERGYDINPMEIEVSAGRITVTMPKTSSMILQYRTEEEEKTVKPKTRQSFWTFG